MIIHPLPSSVSQIPAPQQFTYPFCYQPHPLCLAAADEVRRYIASRTEWKDELQAGKMLGVLVVRKGDEMGFLAAFSGTLDGKTRHHWFVPPVFDLMAPGCWFQQEQDVISDINHRVEALQRQLQPSHLHRQMQQELAAYREQMQHDREERHRLRETLTPSQLEQREPELIRQSQFQKAGYKRLQQSWQQRIQADEAPLQPLRAQLENLQQERRQRSLQLQQWLFRQFTFLNANLQEQSLLQLFHPFAPPSGAGDCCAPKLLQAAYQQHLQPLCMAEFWVGASPHDEIRQEGHFYPACQSKCKPILTHMLQGLDVEPNPLLARYDALLRQVRIVYKDEAVAVVYKPSGMLSVPGKEDLPSVQSLLQQRFPGALMVHRLDMDTSGLMVVALTAQAYHHLQQQFLRHQVQKRYIALLDGTVSSTEGDISLPLRPDYMARPRQLVDPVHGKPTQTHYRVLSVQQDRTRVALWPQTGRTHQLRVHCAHPDGLGVPIVGDRLYGQPSDRLMLHAEWLRFQHPGTGETVEFEYKEI